LIPFRLHRWIASGRDRSISATEALEESGRSIAQRDPLISAKEQLSDAEVRLLAAQGQLEATERARDAAEAELARLTGALAAATGERDELGARLAETARQDDAARRLGLRPRPSRIFFMHIGKTAGSYVNDMFIRSLGAANCAEHCELFLHDPVLFRRAIADKVFVSGHIYYHDWVRLVGEADRDFLKITFLRDPLEHIISHLRFCEHFSRPELKAAYDNVLNAEVRGVVDMLARVDFASPQAMIQMLETLPPKGVELFDNCQSRYFLAGGDHVARFTDPLGMHLWRPLLAMLAKFDVVGTTGTILPTLRQVGALLGVELQLHEEIVGATASSKRINQSDPAVMRALRQRILLDDALYGAVNENRPAGAARERTESPI
jgi:hypothetical protein